MHPGHRFCVLSLFSTHHRVRVQGGNERTGAAADASVHILRIMREEWWYTEGGKTNGVNTNTTAQQNQRFDMTPFRNMWNHQE